jgi:hypothetical protein
VTAVSPVGAQGVAQFMPGTARERGLTDPFDPEQAIPHAAHLLADLNRQFGNLGLAAAAYNGGPGRVSAWLAGTGGLPTETRNYVLAITGSPAEDWRPGAAIERPESDTPTGKDGSAESSKSQDAKSQESKSQESKSQESKSQDSKSEASRGKEAEAKPESETSCLKVTAALRIPSRGDRFALGGNEGPAAPWGIQLAGNFSKSLALQSFARTRKLYTSVIGDVRPMIIGTRLRSRGTRAFYRIRIPAQSREAADGLCGRIRQVGGACLVLRT